VKKEGQSDHDVVEDNTSLDYSSLHVYGGSPTTRLTLGYPKEVIGHP
jgi:hypothetical protein